MAGNVVGAWTWIFVAAIALASLAVGVPIAVIKTLACVEAAGSWTLERVHRPMRPRSAVTGGGSSDLLGQPAETAQTES